MQIADLPGLSEVNEIGQGRSQNLFVSPLVAGTAEGTAHRMIDEDGARRQDFGHYVQDRADHQSWN